MVQAEHAPRQVTRRASTSQPVCTLYLSFSLYKLFYPRPFPAPQGEHNPRRNQRNRQPSEPVSSGEDFGLDRISSDSDSEPDVPLRPQASAAPSEASIRPTLGSTRTSSSVQDIPAPKRKGEKKARDIDHFFDRKSVKGRQVCTYCRLVARSTWNITSEN